MSELNGEVNGRQVLTAQIGMARKGITGQIAPGRNLSGQIRQGEKLSASIVPSAPLNGVIDDGGRGGGELSDITVKSGAATFVELPAAGFYGIGSVTVEGDEDLIPENIKEGVTILGVDGGYSPKDPVMVVQTVDIVSNGPHVFEPPDGYAGIGKLTANVAVPTEVVLQSKSVTPGHDAQRIVPDSDDGFNGLSEVWVAGDDNLHPENIRENVTIFGVTGTFDDSQILQDKTVTPRRASFAVEADGGYTGLSKVYVAGDEDLIPSNIREGATIFGIAGSYSSGTKYQDKAVTPSRNGERVIADAGYNALAQVMVNGDTNLVPSNIAKGVTIFGVTGTYKSPMKHITVVPSEDEQFIIPADGFDGFSSITVLPGAGSGGSGELVAYLLNGIPVPVLPTWDEKTYPCALFCIFMNGTPGLYVGKSVVYRRMSDNRYQIGLNGCMVGTFTGAWRLSASTLTDYWIADVDSASLKWANFDILNEDGSVCLYATDPIPVYK